MDAGESWGACVEVPVSFVGLGALLDPECCWSWMSFVDEYCRAEFQAEITRVEVRGAADANNRDLIENMIADN